MKHSSIIAIPFLFAFLLLYWEVYYSALFVGNPSKEVLLCASCNAMTNADTRRSDIAIPVLSLPSFAIREKNRKAFSYFSIV